MFQALLILHIIAGFTSIILFWLPIFTKKGGNLHVRIGSVYVYAMWVVVISAAILSVIRIFQGYYEMAIFLGYLSLITAKPLWLGISILKKTTQRFWKIKLMLESLIFIGGLGLFILGILWSGHSVSILALIFGSLGILSIFELINTGNKKLKRNKIQLHLAEMLTSGIAGYTAFLAFGARQFLESLLNGYWAVVPWVLPTVAGIIAIRMMIPKYGTSATSS